MIDKLTPEQTAKMSEYVEKYTRLGLSTSPLTDSNKAEIKEIMGRVYQAADLTPPKDFYFCLSPVACLVKFKEITGKDPKNELQNFCWGSHSAGWLSFYAFMHYEVGVKNLEKVIPLIDLLGKCNFYLPYDTACIISANPTAITMVNGRLHNVAGPAWEYADGFCGYSLDGVAVTKEILDCLNGVSPIENVLKIQNVEQRLVAIKYTGPERLLKHLNTKVLDTKGSEYVLHSFSLEGENCIMLEMQNPSEPKKHYEFVPPECTTVNKALAWRIGWDSFAEPVVKC